MIGVSKLSTVNGDDTNAFATALLRKSITGKTFYVDGTSGSDARDGSSWKKALKTITQAVSLCTTGAGDVIFMKGSFTEAVVCSKVGVSFIGLGTNPKECSWSAASAAVSATAGFCLNISANYCRVENVYFKPVVYTSSGTPSAISLSGANWAVIKNCRFQGQTGSYKAIYSAVCDSDNVTIENCQFYYMNTATNGCAIFGVEAGGLSYSGWTVKNCQFHSCLKAIDVNMRCGTITGCTINEYGINPAGAIAQLLALGIDLSGTSSGCNAVWGNQLGGTYNATLYKVGASGDQWGGNFNVITGGLTAANPA